MIVGILTFHRAFNIGATLQAYALQEFINDNICDAELVDFYPNNGIPARRTFMRIIAHGIRRVINYKKVRQDRDKQDAFQLFWNKYYRVSDRAYYGDNDAHLMDAPYGVIISGSDQILNCTLTGNTKAYYLSFANKTKRISYASSFGRETITDKEHDFIKSELSKFSAISVREKSAADIIHDDLGIMPRVVVDPVFLLDKKKWESMMELQRQGKYIFVYAMEATPQIQKAIEFASSLYKMPIITVCGGKSAEVLPGKKIVVCGPELFLSFIWGADIVVTNSFHGTALSFIFGKKVIVAAHSSRNTRLKNIMEIADQSSKLVSSETCVNEEHIVDGKDAYDKITGLIMDSKEFLKYSI